MKPSSIAIGYTLLDEKFTLKITMKCLLEYFIFLQNRNVIIIFRIILVCLVLGGIFVCLFVCYCISTFVGYLMPNLFLYK